jgi:hypothetical protein
MLIKFYVWISMSQTWTNSIQIYWKIKIYLNKKTLRLKNYLIKRCQYNLKTIKKYKMDFEY